MSPIWKVLAPSASRIDGVRDTQLAIATPHSPKMTKTALRQATTWRRVSTTDPAVMTGDWCGVGHEIPQVLIWPVNHARLGHADRIVSIESFRVL